MTPSKTGAPDLTARAAEVINEIRQVAYAEISPELTIASTSENFQAFLLAPDASLEGRLLSEVLMEFVGAEDTLMRIMGGEVPTFRLERVHRDKSNGSTGYLTFHVLPIDEQNPGNGLLLVIDDESHSGQIEHNLLQSRNELHLTKRELERTNANLDKRVEQRTKELEIAKKKIEQQLYSIQALRQNDLAILSTTDLRLALKTIVETTKKHLGVDAVRIMVLDQYLFVLETISHIGYQTSVKSLTQLGEGVVGQAALERRSFAYPNFSEKVPDDSSIQNSSEGFQALFVEPLIAKGRIVGVINIEHREPLDPDQEWFDFLKALVSQAAMAIDNLQAFEDLQRSHTKLALAYDTTIAGWSHALDLRDKETKGHTNRVTEMTIRLARRAKISEAELVHIKRGALLHDIGKMGIPDTILHKRSELTDEEWEIMRKHPVYAYEMLFPIEYLRPALDVPYYHHEKWDGTGYPCGLKGEEIPMAARLFSVVDVWDALQSDRGYRKGWSVIKTQEYVRDQSGIHFDPKIVELFLESLEQIILDLSNE